MGNTATERQIDLINRLKEERTPTEEAREAIELSRQLWMLKEFTTSAASALIDAMMESPRKQKTIMREVPEGMHMLNDQIYKVQIAVHGSGRPYAKKLVVIEPDCGGCANGEPCGAGCTWTASFEIAPGMMKYLSEDTKMTIEQAKEFGALYGTCCVCGRTLTDENSIAAGIGPVCAGKFAL